MKIINGGCFSSNHRHDDYKHKRVFGIMFRVGLLFSSFKTSIFVDKPLFLFFCFFFQNPNFALPDVMIEFDRASNKR